MERALEKGLLMHSDHALQRLVRDIGADHLPGIGHDIAEEIKLFLLRQPAARIMRRKNGQIQLRREPQGLRRHFKSLRDIDHRPRISRMAEWDMDLRVRNVLLLHPVLPA